MSRKGFYSTQQRRETRESQVLFKAMPKTLGDLPSDYRRVIIRKVERRTEKGLLVDINGTSIWLPRSQVKVGLHPSGLAEAIDIPLWLATKHSLVTPSQM